jgi:hypothetical protein
MPRQIEFDGQTERICKRERCIGPTVEDLNPIRRNTL